MRKKKTESKDTVNKKVRNATPCEADGIQFRSKFERSVYQHLVKAGYKPEYESETFELLPHFRTTAPWYMDGKPVVKKDGTPSMIQAWHYTPDFKIKLKKNVVYIEVKGSENDITPYKRKMFLHLLEEKRPEALYAQINTIRGLYTLLGVMDKL